MRAGRHRRGGSQAFLTVGRRLASRSEEIISVGKTRGGSGFEGVAGEHFRLKVRTMGVELETGSPLVFIRPVVYTSNGMHVYECVERKNAPTCLTNQSTCCITYVFPSNGSTCVGAPKYLASPASYSTLHSVPYDARLHLHPRTPCPLFSFCTRSATLPLQTTSWGSGATRICRLGAEGWPERPWA